MFSISVIFKEFSVISLLNDSVTASLCKKYKQTNKKKTGGLNYAILGGTGSWENPV